SVASTSAGGSWSAAIHDVRPPSALRDSYNASPLRSTIAIDSARWRSRIGGGASSPDLDGLRAGASGNLRRVHLFGPRRRDDERSRRRGANHIRELVMSLGQPGGKQLDPIIVPLDVIERT